MKVIMTTELEQRKNDRYNKKASDNEMKLIKARFTKEEINCIDELKQDKSISADSKVLKYIVNDYFKQQLGNSDVIQEIECKTNKAKMESLEEELVELKELIFNLTDENKQLLTNLSELPFEDKLRNYSHQVLEAALNKTARHISFSTNIHEVRLECRNIPDEVFNLYQYEIIELYENAFDNGYMSRGDDIEAVIDKLELSNLIIINKDKLTLAFQKSSVSSFSFIQKNDHKIDSVSFAKWYKKELESILNNMKPFSHRF